MADFDILNLDDILPQPRRVRVHGKDYDVEAPSTEGYLRLLQLRRHQAKQSQEDELAQTEQALAMIMACIPTIDEQELRSLKVNQLMKLVDLVQEVSDLGDVEKEGAKDGKPGE